MTSLQTSAAETVCIAGVGFAVPKNIRANSEILKSFPNRTEEEIVRLTGIKERRYADDDESATSLAAMAVEHALGQAGVPVADIDTIIMATIIPDQPVPSMASALAALLGIPRATAFDLNAACSGWLYALEVGRSLILGGSARNVIVVTAELLSRITNPQDHETAFLFGDGAGAAILTRTPGGHRLHRMGLSGDAEQFAAIQRTGGGARIPWPDSQSDLNQFYIQMDGVAVFKHAVVGFAEQIEETLRRHRLGRAAPGQCQDPQGGQQEGGDPLREVRGHHSEVRQHERGQRLDGARLGGGGGHLRRGRQDHLLQRGRRAHVRGRPPRLVTPGQPESS
jgi:3-oxoacyl-[acyl-carrier-protein] synthase-3